MALEKQSPCKVNLLLNILGKRVDGFHELETVLQPVKLFDTLSLDRVSRGLHLTCSDPRLPANSGNLVHRAAAAFLQRAEIRDGVSIHLEKKIPLAAGLGGGSADAATTLLGLNELFGKPLSTQALHQIAAALGSDVPFFLQSQPALATGRGENLQPLGAFPALRGAALLLIHPGFGIATAWAYQNLSRFPAALNGEPGRAQELIALLRNGDLPAAAAGLYNSLEAPAHEKYPVLALYQEFLRAHGAAGTLMSGSGSTTFALVRDPAAAEQIAEEFQDRFGRACWIKIVPA